MSMKTSRPLVYAGLLACGLAGLAQAQTPSAPTDAGQTLKQFETSPQPLPPGKGLAVPSEIRSQLESGGRTVTVQSLAFEGNEHVASARLLQALGPSRLNQPLDMAALRDMVDTLTDTYRASGYPFARAFLLPGSLRDGVLTVTLVEGRYGKVVAINDDAELAASVQNYLARLRSGDPVTAGPLERASLLISDMPGLSATPVMKPGEQVGLGDLNMVVEAQEPVQASLSLDNFGGYYTGKTRALADVRISQAWLFGDEVSLTAMAPLEGMWLGALGYAIPLGAQGVRLKAGYAKTGYALGAAFDGFQGTAIENNLSLSYPVLRSRLSNLGVSVGLKSKRLRDDRQGEIDYKRVDAIPVVLNFDHRDGVGQGGVSYGQATWVAGRLTQSGQRTHFSRWMLDVARLQRLNASWNLYAHLVTQGAQDNLDSSEGITLGGASSVRAYPSGEASGDTGWIAQFELRKALGQSEVYAFYDHGRVKVDARPELVNAPAPDMMRAGAGLGVRFKRGPMNVNAALAWRTQGGAPTSSVYDDKKPRVLLSAAYSF